VSRVILCRTIDRDGFAALLLGAALPDGGFRYVGRVGTGFDSNDRRDIYTRLRLLRTDKSPLVGYIKRTEARAAWVKPELTADIDFRDVTKTARLRHTSFKGLRNTEIDKSPNGEFLNGKALHYHKKI